MKDFILKAPIQTTNINYCAQLYKNTKCPRRKYRVWQRCINQHGRTSQIATPESYTPFQWY